MHGVSTSVNCMNYGTVLSPNALCSLLSVQHLKDVTGPEWMSWLVPVSNGKEFQNRTVCMHCATNEDK